MIKDLNYKISEEPSNKIDLLVSFRDKIPSSAKIFQPTSKIISINEAKKESEEFMNSHFKLHKIYIGMSFDVNLPYNIPIKKTVSKIATVESGYSTFCNEYIVRMYRKINIPEKTTEFTPSSITHEITHTQQETGQDITEHGLINYYTNVEILPILLEIIHYTEKSSINENYKRPILLRLKSLIGYINNLDTLISLRNSPATIDNKDDSIEEKIISYSKYIESTLKALNLFEIYVNSKENKRKEIINHIQNIFDANRTVEEFLDYYDTTFESSLISVQKKLK